MNIYPAASVGAMERSCTRGSNFTNPLNGNGLFSAESAAADHDLSAGTDKKLSLYGIRAIT